MNTFHRQLRFIKQNPSFNLRYFSSFRPPSNNLSLDSSLISTNYELVKSHLVARRCNEDIINNLDKVVELRLKRNSLIVQGDVAKNMRKSISLQIGQLMKDDKNNSSINDLKQQVEEFNHHSSEANEELRVVDEELKDILSIIPNLLDDSIPDGSGEKENIIVSSWGDDIRKVGSEYKWHDDIAVKLNGLNNEAATRMSGTRFSILQGSLARLERALIQYFLDFHINRGYNEVSIPYIVSRTTLEGTGQLPKFEDDLFKVNHKVAGEDAFLIPTAEVPVTNIYREQILNLTDLPIYHVTASPSFRAEAGSAGRDTRGLLRQHQFHKVELVKICTAESSKIEHESMVNDVESLLQSLELPYRKVLLCSGDIGFSSRICYDIEVWLPGQQDYREISSISNCYDFQSKRMSLRYKDSSNINDKKGKKTLFPHTLNGSGVAVGRALVAILENNQCDDGSVIIPEKLRAYMGNITKLTPK